MDACRDIAEKLGLGLFDAKRAWFTSFEIETANKIDFVDQFNDLLNELDYPEKKGGDNSDSGTETSLDKARVV